MKRLLASLLLSLSAAFGAYGQSAVVWPDVISPSSTYDFGNGPLKVRVISGIAYLFTSQGSGLGSTSGSSTSLTLTATPATANKPIVGAKIVGTGITAGTTVAAYNGTTGVTLSAAMNVAASTSLSWGAACPATVGSAPYVSASAGVDYYTVYTAARICGISPGAPAEYATTVPYPETSSSGGGGDATAANQTSGAQKTQIVDSLGNVVATTSNNLNVQCANCSGSGASAVDEAAFTAGASVFAPTGGFFQTTATDNALTNGKQGMQQFTANRAGFVNLRNASGVEIGVAAAELFVGGRGTAGSAAGGVVSIQGVAAMTPILANPGTAANWGVQTQGSTTSGQSGGLTQGAVTTAAPSYTTAQTSPLSLDTGGLLRTRVDNTVTVSGTVTATNASVAATGGAVPASATYAGINIGGNITGAVGGHGTAAGALRVELPTDGTGVIATVGAVTAITNALPAGANVIGHVITDTGSTTAVTGSVTTTNAALALAQGSTTSGQTGPLVQGAVTTANPTYTTAQTSPLSLDTAGGLRVSVIAGGGTGGTASNFGAAFPAAGTAAGMSVGGNMVALTGTGTNLNVQCANCSGSGASAADEAAFTAGADVFAPSGGFFQTTATSNALTNGQQGMAQMTANRAFHVNLRTTAGVNLGDATTPLQVSLANTGTNATAVKVDGSAVTQPVSGTVTATVAAVGATGSAVPASAMFNGLSDGTNLRGWLQAATGLNSTGTGIGSAQIVGQCDDTSPTALSENQFGNGRLDCTDHALAVAGLVTTNAPTYTTATARGLSLTTAGGLRTDLATVAGTAVAAGNGAASGALRVALANDSTGIVQNVPGTSGGLTPFTVNAAASDNHAVVKAGAGQIYSVTAFNNNAAANYIRFYNATTGFNGCNSATNLAFSGIIPGATTGTGFVVPIPEGLAFATGISICITGAFGNTDTTNAVTSTSVNVGYK